MTSLRIGFALALLVATACSAESVQPAPGGGSAVAVARYRDGLAAVIAYLDARPALVPRSRRDEPQLLSPDERLDLLRTWGAFSDYLLALDSLGRAQRDAWVQRGTRRDTGFHVMRAAFLARYRFALDFIARVERDPGLDTILNEALPEVGLPAGSYDRLELRYLNAGIALEFSALDAFAESGGEGGPAALTAGVDADRRAIWAMGRGRGPVLTLKNAGEVIGGLAHRAWFPVQAGIADAMGDAKVWRAGRSLIGLEQRRALVGSLEPGDILLTRREWYLSNIGLPGFWTHAALYVGTREEREAYFGDAAPALAVARPRLPSDAALPARVIEAIGEGVVFTSIEHAAEADSLAVLRPRLSREGKARALARAFGFAGRPYDFDFDFLTDAELVCTELVYKSYQPAADAEGLALPLQSILGRVALPANGIARFYGEERRHPGRQLDFVLFLDGDERAAIAREATEADFLTSWQRPKWHVVVPASP